jgi:DNA-directed RNA polymerase specialized sigma24 family protein
VDILPDPTWPIPDQIVESSEFQQALAPVLRQLPTDWREPFLLHTRDGLSLHDLAQLDGVSVAEVRHRIDKAREFLRARLLEEYQDSLLPPPTESIFEVLDRIEPTAEPHARARAQIQVTAA